MGLAGRQWMVSVTLMLFGSSAALGQIAEATIKGTPENDSFSGLENATLFAGDAGRDTVDYSASLGPVGADLIKDKNRSGVAAAHRYVGIENLRGSRHDDYLGGDGRGNTLFGGPGDDVIDGRGGNNRIFGGPGNDRLIADGGRDVLRGGVGNDVLTARGGADLLVGGPGDDMLRGGPGADIFVFGLEDGQDVIADFRLGEDQLQIEGIRFGIAKGGIDPIEFISLTAQKEDQDAILRFATGSSIRLQNIFSAGAAREIGDLVAAFDVHVD